jgi:6,7-dimethyl-8-ribityllumazine synthase
VTPGGRYPIVDGGGGDDAAAPRFAIAVATFYDELAQRLVRGAREAFADAGAIVADEDVVEVPGAYELPMAAKLLAETGRYAGVACLGAVIRGETDHYDWVCGAAAQGIMDVQLSTGVPTAFGVLTTDDYEQALARSDVDAKRDSGRHAAEAVLALAGIARTLRG